MRKEIEEIREALIAIDALDEKTTEALSHLEESIDEIESHPASDKVREVVSGTPHQVKTEDSPSASDEWHSLRDHLVEWEDHHPRVTLVIGKMAEALAVVGL
jgi:hypothetical protein